ncbi:MAG: hypothetical protein KGQ49_04995 [Verrucomicrobia bacterium]|nr:hypothetical protein [Verrucomicrobiota bacterium]MBU6446737.1 hypothetical protein [Verrucomicrobiota bacterium]MDE3047568.1 hypothetical protein [Verrucomicrobiota bacterium]
MSLSVTSIVPIRERVRDEEQQSEWRQVRDSKVQGLVLERLGHTIGGLLPSACAPQIVQFFYSQEQGHKKRKPKLRKTPMPRKTPIGLMPADPEGRVNALMQFILYVPGFADCFSIAPRSLFPIQECIDRYHQDLAEGRAFSNASPLIALFELKFPHYSVREIVEALFRLVMPKWQVQRTLQEALYKSRTADLFLAVGGLKKQLYIEPEQYYDLDAFIEKRPDGSRTNYIAYVKVDGCWYQCDDERITHLRSDLLALPLERSTLCHFRKVLIRT